jgi:preprotein translocase subunit SecF
VVAVLFFFGGSVIHDFSFALLWGVFVGSYSTIFVAAPIIYEWQARGRPQPVPVKK